jgi:serine/threonine-protein kinase
VLDFGVAKLRGDPVATATDDKLTATGMIIGTAPYMSPEQWHSRPDIDGRADIYALGVRGARRPDGSGPRRGPAAWPRLPMASPRWWDVW